MREESLKENAVAGSARLPGQHICGFKRGGRWTGVRVSMGVRVSKRVGVKAGGGRPHRRSLDKREAWSNKAARP